MTLAKETQTNTHSAVERLKQLIVHGELAAGSNHFESELADRLGMSRTPVREAFLMLETQGLLQVVPRRGVKITAITTQDMREIYQLLTVLEGLAAELAAKRKPSDAELRPVERAIRDMDDTLETDDLAGWAKADAAFHQELVLLSGNQRLLDTTRLYTLQSERARSLTLQLRPKPTKSNDDHRNVVNAIRAGDEKLARKLHERHRHYAGELLIGVLQQYGFHQV